MGLKPHVAASPDRLHHFLHLFGEKDERLVSLGELSFGELAYTVRLGLWLTVRLQCNYSAVHSAVTVRLQFDYSSINIAITVRW